MDSAALPSPVPTPASDGPARPAVSPAQCAMAEREGMGLGGGGVQGLQRRRCERQSTGQLGCGKGFPRPST